MNWLALLPIFASIAQGSPLCDVKNFGARGDGTTRDTRAIQAAIDSCAAAGGGTVRLHDGVFLSGMIRLKSGIHFLLEPTATLKGTQDDADYPDTHPVTNNSQLNNCRKALVYAERANNLVIDGGGVIDGNGNTPKWLGPGSLHPERTRPMAIYLVQSTNVLIEGIQMKDAAMWGIVNLETDHLQIRNLKIHTPLSGNRDGIDVVDCHDVLIEKNEIFSEDDSICLKSGTARGVEDVVVRDNHILQSSVANGLKLGTASTGAFRRVTFENNIVENVDKAAMAVESVDGAAIQNVTFRGIRFHGAGTGIFVLLGKRGTPPGVGSIEGVVFDDVQGSQMKHGWGSAISGTVLAGVTYAPKDVSLKNVHISYLGGGRSVPVDPPEYAGQYPDPNLWGNLPAAGLFVRHVKGFQLIDSTIDVAPMDARPAVVKRDVN